MTRQNLVWVGILLTALTGALVSCSASGDGKGFSAQGGAGGSDPDAGTGGILPDGGGGTDANVFIPDSSLPDVSTEIPINPCATGCGAEELCDEGHLGYDDDCDGEVDEDCACTPGLSHWCFKGDPASRNKGACKDGVEQCSELGIWGPCVGGLHGDAVDDCLGQGTPTGCHDLAVPPFTPVHLKDGTGTFGAGATDEHFDVACPPSIPAGNCPQVQNPDSADATFTPLQSGQYTVTYTKSDGSGGQVSCTFSIYVGASGLRVELNWDHQGEGSPGPSGTFGPDLDLHVHRPGFRTGWFGLPGLASDDCYYANCTAPFFVGALSWGPNWFSDTAYPHNWTYRLPYDPNDPIYTCYNAPRGAGGQWRLFNRGCHNPRLDLDNVTCNNTRTDPNDAAFCAPENVNIDEPPEGLWTRIGVHYFGNCFAGDLHPTVTIFCNGGQVAQFGPTGFNAPVTLPASSCTGDGTPGNAFWLVADVMVAQGVCGDLTCHVQPIFSDINTQTPWMFTANEAQGNFGPPCAPGPGGTVGCF